MFVSSVLFLSKCLGFVSQCKIFSCFLPCCCCCCCCSPFRETDPGLEGGNPNYPVYCLTEDFLIKEHLKERPLPTMMMEEPAGYTFEDPHEPNQSIPTDGLPQDTAATVEFGFMEESLRMPTFSLDELSHPANNLLQTSTPLVDNTLQHHLGDGFDLEQEVLQTHHLDHQSTWVDPTTHQQQQHFNQQYYYTADEQQHHHVHVPLQCYDTAVAAAAAAIPFPDPLSAATAPDLLNLLHLPRCSTMAPVLPGSAQAMSSFNSPGRRSASGYPLDIFGGEIPAPDGCGFYDPSSVHIGYGSGQPAPQTTSHLLRDLFQSLPQSYGLFPGGMDVEREATVVGGGLQHGMPMFGGEEEDGMGIGGFENPVFEYRRGEKGNFATEKHRRLQMNHKYSDLKALIPNPTKTDRASIVLDAIEYIHELQRTVAELKLLIDKKRFGRAKMVKTKNTADADNTAADMESSSMRPLGDVDQHADHFFNGPLRSSWLQRRSRETFVDVRIVDNEVNVKLTQKKKANCLLLATKALDELQLDAIHISGGFIGEHYIFMFNTKICEGSSVYASAIANKLLEAMERSHPLYPSGF